MIHLFVLSLTLWVVLASSTSGDQHFYDIVTLCRPPPHQHWDEREWLVTASPVMTKSWGPCWGKQLPTKS